MGGRVKAAYTAQEKREFGMKLRQEMGERRLSPPELAKQATHKMTRTGAGPQSVTADMIGKYQRGETIPGPKTLAAICLVLGKKGLDLLPRMHNDAPPLPDLGSLKVNRLDISSQSGETSRVQIDAILPTSLAMKILAMVHRTGAPIIEPVPRKR